jgi:hypothetical protein
MTQSSTDRAEAASIRRRWISLGEFVAVAGLLIAAIGLWLNYSDHREAQTAKQAEKAQSARYEVSASVTGNGDLVIVRDPAHPLAAAQVTFPAALSLQKIDLPSQKIELRSYRAALLRATDKEPHESAGRLPILLRVDYWDGDARRTTTGIFDIAWRSEGRLILGRTIRIDGMTLRERGGSIDRLNQLWRASPH